MKILDPEIKVTATCVRVPVFNCHAESINIEFESPMSADEARSILMEANGVTVIDRPSEGQFITPVEIVREDNVFVSRIRNDPTVENGLNIWVVSDNVRKGAALNAVQIAEELINNYL
jgi:aspartate-semialdehyde dehydrogenase